MSRCHLAPWPGMPATKAAISTSERWRACQNQLLQAVEQTPSSFDLT